MVKRQDLKALRNMVAQAKRLLETAPELPEGRSSGQMSFWEMRWCLQTIYSPWNRLRFSERWVGQQRPRKVRSISAKSQGCGRPRPVADRASNPNRNSPGRSSLVSICMDSLLFSSVPLLSAHDPRIRSRL